MKNVLIVCGHTDLATSVANKAILEVLSKQLPEARIVKLSELYPDFTINRETEQQRLLHADIVVLQFPLFWYTTPSILNRWMEETFLHGFAYGSTGDKLKGKKMVLSFTSGAPKEMYQPGGPMGNIIEELVSRYKIICQYCQMEFAGYVYTGGVSFAFRTTPELVQQQQTVSEKHAERLLKLLETL